MDDWYGPDGFRPGALYADADGQLCLEYAGALTAGVARRLTGESDVIDTDSDAEAVLMFVVVGDGPLAGTLYTHTKSDADRGYGFTALEARLRTDCRRNPRRVAPQPSF
jgi:hypothetical protein